MILGKYKAIIYDWDGTLSNSEDWVVSAHNHVRAHYGLTPWTKKDIFSSSSLSSRELYPQIFGDKADEALAMLYAYTTQHNLESAVPYEGAEDLLRYVQSQNISQALVSNKRHEPLNEVVNHLNWKSYFKCAIGAGYCDRDKPAADPLLKCLELMNEGLQPQDILYVGDTETDLTCAKNTGCDAAFIQSDKQRPDLIEKYKPVISCSNVSELMEVLRG